MEVIFRKRVSFEKYHVMFLYPDTDLSNVIDSPQEVINKFWFKRNHTDISRKLEKIFTNQVNAYHRKHDSCMIPGFVLHPPSVLTKNKYKHHMCIDVSET
jgi:hypothetical protein